MFDIIRNKKGVALLMTIGILAIMSIIATSFALNMKLELEAAANYLRSVKALYLAESGINKVIADIRSQVSTNTYSSVIAYVTGYSTAEQSVDSLGTYQVRIGREIGSVNPNIGEDQKVNLNALDDTDYTAITALKTAGLNSDDIAKIIDYRDSDTDVTSQICTALGTWESCTGNETGTKNSPFSSVEEVKLIIGDTKYDNIKNDITIYGPIIRGGLLAEYYDSISGSSPNVVIDKASFKGKVIELGEICQWNWPGWTWNSMPGTDGDWRGWYEAHDAAWAGGYLLTSATGYRMDTFGVIFEGYLEILPAEVGSPVTFYMRNDDGAKLFIDGTQVVNAWWNKDPDPEISGTYTFNYAGWHSIRLEYYENTGVNTCCFKWSLAGHDDTDASGTGNYVPAERLGFNPIITHPKEAGISYPSAGVYNITCIGKVKTTDGTVLAEKKVTAAVKIFGVWTQTTREDFYAAWFSDPGTITGATNSSKYFPGNYADGHVFNVTWLNSCPDNASSNLEAGGFTTTTNALKLGYWDDYDEDLAYSVVNLMAMARKRMEAPPGTFPPNDNLIEVKWWDWTAYPSGCWFAYWNNYDPAGTGYFALTFPNITADDVGGNNTSKVKVDTEPFTELYFEVNYNYYRPVTNIFSRAWTHCSEYPSHRIGWRGNASDEVAAGDADWGKRKWYWDPVLGWEGSYWYYDTDDDGYHWRDTDEDPLPNEDGVKDADEDWDPDVYEAYKIVGSGPDLANDEKVHIYDTSDLFLNVTSDSSTGQYWQPCPNYVVPHLFPYGDRDDTYYNGELDSSGYGYYTLVVDEDGWMFPDNNDIWSGDRLEIALNYDMTWARLVPANSYGLTNVLAMIKKGNSSAAYKAYWNNGALSVELTPTGSPDIPNFKFKSNNAYETNYYRLRAIWLRGAPGNPIAPLNQITQYWDNVRFIPDNGILVSTPFYPGQEVDWGRLSWTDNTAAVSNVGVSVEIRTATTKDDLPTGDPGTPGKSDDWTSYGNGDEITDTNSYPWLQYKVTLSTTALDKDNYTNSGKTPIFQDITITYLPQVEVLYYREVTEQ